MLIDNRNPLQKYLYVALLSGFAVLRDAMCETEV